MEQWKEPFGNLRQDRFFGQHLDEARIRAALDACLIGDAELADGFQAWGSLPDPFPLWELPG